MSDTIRARVAVGQKGLRRRDRNLGDVDRPLAACGQQLRDGRGSADRHSGRPRSRSELTRQIEEWLGDLGLGEYASRLIENDIDFEILCDLTDQDLEKIGVASLGHRRKLLRAISELNASLVESVWAVKPPASSLEARTAAPEPEPLPVNATAERRYLTVLFCDLVDSTGIASRLDAEEWRDVVGGYFEAASAAVTAMGGTIAKKLGDGLMALFGYPTAHENDAERAARAALAIQRRVKPHER